MVDPARCYWVLTARTIGGRVGTAQAHNWYSPPSRRMTYPTSIRRARYSFAWVSKRPGLRHPRLCQRQAAEPRTHDLRHVFAGEQGTGFVPRSMLNHPQRAPAHGVARARKVRIN